MAEPLTEEHLQLIEDGQTFHLANVEREGLATAGDFFRCTIHVLLSEVRRLRAEMARLERVAATCRSRHD